MDSGKTLEVRFPSRGSVVFGCVVLLLDICCACCICGTVYRFCCVHMVYVVLCTDCVLYILYAVLCT